MFDNSFLNRVACKLMCALLLPPCLLWGLWQLLRPAAGDPVRDVPAQELPSHWEGRPLRPLVLTSVEQRFAERFPGSIARLSVAAPPRDTQHRSAPGKGDPVFDGRQVLVLRTVERPTRMLHPAADCYRAAGWRVGGERLQMDAREHLWRCFEADRQGRRLRVCERIAEPHGPGFTDTSAWYWAALAGRSQGPWQAITLAEAL